MLTDPIADMLTRIRNANKAMHDSAQMPTSRMKEEIARLLKDEGYIKDFRVVEGAPFSTLVVELKFGRNRERVFQEFGGFRDLVDPAAVERRIGRVGRAAQRELRQVARRHRETDDL